MGSKHSERKIWITADWHFNHDKPFIYQKRGFSSIDEMNETIIKKYNELVDENDKVYVLGDVFLGDADSSIALLKRLKGEKHLIIGNHDSNVKVSKLLHKKIFVTAKFADRITIGKWHYMLSHIPYAIDDNRYKIFCLCGHTHSNNFLDDKHKYCYQIGIDAWNFKPVLLSVIHEDIKKNHATYWSDKND